MMVQESCEIQAVLRTLLLSDLVKSTLLVERLGDRRAAELFARHDRLARDLLPEYGGVEIDKTDGFLMLFERPIDAVLYAMEYHRVLAGLREETGIEIAARVGVHLGEVYLHRNSREDIERGAKPLEVEGLAKPMAARIMSLATASQTLLTRGAFDLARRAAAAGESSMEELNWLAHGPYRFKGVSEPVEVFEVGIEGEAPLAPPADSEKVRRVGDEGGVLGWRPSPGAEIPTRKRWKLVRQLGEGGFGEVWLAAHAKTGEQRVFKFCFDADRLRNLQREVTLFRVLKESLGNRPDIARILDWNFEESPYFIETEFSEDGDLLKWLEEQGSAASVDFEVRLELLAQVADALAAAHSVGVLHKDIKPANILIRRDSSGEAKIMLTDFGIGALTRDASELGITIAGMTVCETDGVSSGTSLYMAPELFEGKPPSVQADIFSLGVLSYQLLSGHMGRALAPGWERSISSELLREDLRAMVEGNPERRLADAGEIARRFRSLRERERAREEELQREREAEEIRRALRRNRRRRKLVSIVAAALAVVAVVLGFQAHRISVEARRARREARTAEEVRNFLEGLFEISDPESGKGRTVTAREVLDAGAAKIQSRLRGEPVTQARMMDVMGRAYLNLGLYSKARPLLEEALKIQERELGREHPDRAGTLEALGRLETRQGQPEKALKTLEEALEIRKAGGDAADCGRVWVLLAEARRAQGRFDLAIEAERKADKLGAGKQGSATDSGTGRKSVSHAVIELEASMDLLKRYDAFTVVSPGKSLAGIGARSIDIIDRRGVAAPIHEAFAGERRILDSLPDGQLLKLEGHRVFLGYGSWVREAPPDRLLFDHASSEDSFRLSEEGGSFARFNREVIEVYSLKSTGISKIFSRKLGQEQPVTHLLLSSRYLVWTFGRGQLRALKLDSGDLILQQRIEGALEALSIDDHRGLLAGGGWMDEVYVFDLEARGRDEVIKSAGRCYGLLFLEDFPSLVITRHGSIQLWRPGSGIVSEMGFPGESLEVMGWIDGRILVENFHTPRLMIFSYHSFPMEENLQVASAPIWAMTRQGGRVYAGSADGSIVSFDPGSLQLRAIKAHEQGVTALLVDEHRLVSASDDKTLAVWKLPELEEEKRTKAHTYLINSLFLDRQSSTLFSTSSDGALKTWNWPGLEERAVYSISPMSKAAIWIDAGNHRGILGSWEHRWYRLREEQEGWVSAGEEEIPSQAAYQIREIPELHGTLILGIYPTSLVFVDGGGGPARMVPLPDGVFSWIIPMGGGRFLLTGDFGLADYRCSREGSTLACSVSRILQSDCVDPGAGTFLPKSGRVVIGTGLGKLLVFRPEDLPRNQLMEFSLDFSD